MYLYVSTTSGCPIIHFWHFKTLNASWSQIREYPKRNDSWNDFRLSFEPSNVHVCVFVPAWEKKSVGGRSRERETEKGKQQRISLHYAAVGVPPSSQTCKQLWHIKDALPSAAHISFLSISKNQCERLRLSPVRDVCWWVFVDWLLLWEVLRVNEGGFHSERSWVRERSQKVLCFDVD